MNLEEILQEVDRAEPELMAKTAKIMALTEKLHPEYMNDIANDFETICSVLNEKTASDKVTGLKPYLAAIGVTAGAGILSALATDLYDASKRGLTKGRDLKRIMEANPGLKRELDKKQMELAFNALHRFAPEFMADPLVGGALLKQVAELPQMSHKTIVELIGARKNLHEAGGRMFADVAKQTPFLLPDAVKKTNRSEYTDPNDRNRKHTFESQRNSRPGE